MEKFKAEKASQVIFTCKEGKRYSYEVRTQIVHISALPRNPIKIVP